MIFHRVEHLSNAGHQGNLALLESQVVSRVLTDDEVDIGQDLCGNGRQSEKEKERSVIQLVRS